MTGSLTWLQEVTTVRGGYMELQVVTMGLRWLKKVTRG